MLTEHWAELPLWYGDFLLASYLSVVAYICQCYSLNLSHTLPSPDFPGGSDGKASLQFWRPAFSSWVGEISWRRQWQPPPVFLPGKSHWWRSLVGYSLWGRKSQTRLSDFTFTFYFPCCVHKSFLYVYVSILTLKIGSSVPFFKYMIFVFLFLTYFTVKLALGSSTSVQLTQMHKCIPFCAWVCLFYICTTSISNHLSMDS